MNALQKFFLLNKKIDPELLKKRRENIHGFKAKIDLERNWSTRFADLLTNFFGTVEFLFFNICWFSLWIFINSGFIKEIPMFDPFPYGLLTMIVSLEAIFLAIVVLISQNRAAHVADLREEIDLQINVQAEKEITKILNIVDAIHDHLGLPPEDDEELVKMKKEINIDEIEELLKNEEK